MLPAIPTPIPMPFAQNGERRVIPVVNTTPGSADASWATGFPPVTRINKQAGGKPPYGLDFQGIFHTICEHLFFSQSGNTVPWVGANNGQPGLNYFKGAVVQGSDGETYMALKPSGPDTANPDGTGFVGPVNPVGDESGHWLDLKLLYGGMANDELWLTESGTFTAPVTGWYKVLIIDGGNAGGATYNANAGGYATGGAAGRRRWHTVYLTSGTEVPVSIGARGLAGSTLISPGNSSFGELTSEGGAAFSATGDIYLVKSAFNFIAVPGSGPGGGQLDLSVWPPNVGFNYSAELDGVWYGAGGGARLYSDGKYAAGNGAPGGIYLLWHNPAKAGGPVATPALFSARRMASRAAAAPVTVNLYDPETGQGSVWREEDAEARLAEGLIPEEAWREICAQKAAEEHAAWLADPETLAGRFAMLRAAREIKLADYDVAVAELRRKERAGADVTADLAAWDAYAVALCDLPAQDSAPWDGGGELTPWPEEPTVGNAQEQD